MTLNSRVAAVTERIQQRSRNSRNKYLARIERNANLENPRKNIGCGNFAHVVAGCPAHEKPAIADTKIPHIGIVTAYNEMLSAHAPYESYPRKLKPEILNLGGTAQVAGGVPAMCDGVTQGRAGMEIGLFSREVIAMSTAVALSHDVFDGVLLLGICDKIVPGLLVGALAFGHLPTLFVPAGPMPSGLSNAEKARVRMEYAQQKIGREQLLAAEMASYHSPGTCTFYGTANSNQLVIEVMGLQLPGSSFVNPDTPLRDAYNRAACEAILRTTKIRGGSGLTGDYRPIGKVVDEKAVVNGIVALLATGGSTNHTLHLVSCAAAAGIHVNWSDFSDLSSVVPLLARIYPNGSDDVNQFAAAGGVQFLVRELLSAGLLHDDVLTMAPNGTMQEYTQALVLRGDEATWESGATASGDNSILRAIDNPFQSDSGIKVLHGNIGEAVIKISAVKREHWFVEAPAVVFDGQDAFLDAFRADQLNRDMVAVIRFQGPRANGMPELHKLTPSLSVLLDKGFKVALLTDGRMSGASGKVPAAIHTTPEALDGGVLAKIRDGDIVRLDAENGSLELLVDAAELQRREAAAYVVPEDADDTGRILFAGFRQMVSPAASGATVFTNLLT